MSSSINIAINVSYLDRF